VHIFVLYIEQNMESNLLKKIILENQQRISALEVLPRDYTIEPRANYIFTGQRRAGKTYFIIGVLQSLVKNGLPPESILYVNFEDERLIGLDVTGFDALLSSYQELFSHKPILFLDEIQVVAGWQKFARRMADTGYQTYITGSNSAMLSKEMASTLGGRFLVREIETLSFREFLWFHGYQPDDHLEFSPSRFEVIRLFGTYFSTGGFPELIRFTDKKEYLSNLFQKVFLGDIIARYQIRNPFALRLLIKKLAESTMDEVAFNRIRNIIASTGIQIGTATVIEYMNYLEDSFLINSIPNFNAKISSRESKKKYYFRDNGLLSLFLAEPESVQIETLVFNHLRKLYGQNVFYMRNGFEVDFLVPGELLVQVCYSLAAAETRKREISALLKAAALHSVKSLMIITFDSEEIIREKESVIQVIPLWKWLLKN